MGAVPRTRRRGVARYSPYVNKLPFGINASPARRQEIPGSDRNRTTQEVIRLSDVVDTGVATLRYSQNHSGSVPVPACAVVAGRASEGSFAEFEALLGSRETSRTRHRRVCGPYQHHLPAGPRALLDEFALRSADRGVRRFPRHRGSGEELGAEILRGDQCVVCDHPARPHPCLVLVPPSGLLLHLRRTFAGSPVSVGRSASLGSASASHGSVRLRQLRRATLAMTPVRQVEPLVGGGRRVGHSPIDTDRRTRRRRSRRFGAAGDDERRVPISGRVAGDAHTRRSGWQFPRPHHRNCDALRQAQSAFLDPEAATGVLESRRRCLPGLELRAVASFHRERRVERTSVGPQRLLLSDLGAGPQPRRSSARLGQLFAQLPGSGSCARLLEVHGFVPQEPAAMPFVEQRAFGAAARTQPEVVTHNLDPHARARYRRPPTDSVVTITSPTLEGGRRFSPL